MNINKRTSDPILFNVHKEVRFVSFDAGGCILAREYPLIIKDCDNCNYKPDCEKRRDELDKQIRRLWVLKGCEFVKELPSEQAIMSMVERHSFDDALSNLADVVRHAYCLEALSLFNKRDILTRDDLMKHFLISEVAVKRFMGKLKRAGLVMMAGENAWRLR